MLIRLKYSGLPTAGIKENKLEVEIPAGSTVEDLLLAAWGKTELPESANFVVNNTIASPKTVLNDNDEVMVLRLLNGG